MREYHKINSLFKRDQRGNFTDQWALDYFEYLAPMKWFWDEKIDGTNIRVNWDGESIKFGGRTEKAQMPIPLLNELNNLFTKDKFEGKPPMTLYGEGYGVKIQKGGGNYIPDGVSFCLFDVLIDNFWLRHTDVNEVAEWFELKRAPILEIGSLFEAIEFVKAGFKSQWGDFNAEGIVMRPVVQLFDRQGKRIIAKLKIKDFPPLT